MADSTRVREVAWLELFPWLRIAGAIKIAFSPSVLLLAAMALVATAAGWRAIGFIYSGSDDLGVQRILRTIPVEPHSGNSTVANRSSLPWLWAESPDVGSSMTDGITRVGHSPFFRAWTHLSNYFAELFNMQWSFVAFTLLLLLGLWGLIVWSLFGAGITRIAALQLARGDKLGFRAALAYGIRRWPSFLTAALIPMLAVFLLAVPLAVLGLLMRADFFVLIAGIVWPLVLIAGVIMAILLVGLWFGWPLMWPTIAAENTDPFDALSRAYSYTYHRPIRYLMYTVVASVLGFLAWVVVVLFANLLVQLGFWGVSWGAGNLRATEIFDMANSGTKPAGEWSMLTAGSSMIGFWWSCVNVIAHAFLFAYFWSAMTAIYFLLRKDEDGTELEEVAIDEQREAFGLPPLTRDASGVPSVSDMSAIPPVSSPPRQNVPPPNQLPPSPPAG